MSSDLDYGDIIYLLPLYCTVSIMCMVTLFHCITDLMFHLHRRVLYDLHRQQRRYLSISEAMRGVFFYLYDTTAMILAHPELERKPFVCFVPWSWNNLQNTLQLNDFVTTGEFKALIRNCVTEECNCRIKNSSAGYFVFVLTWLICLWVR